MRGFLRGTLILALSLTMSAAHAQQIPTYNAKQSGAWTFGVTGPIPVTQSGMWQVTLPSGQVVNIGNLPAVQPISGAISADLRVSGSAVANGNPVPVSVVSGGGSAGNPYPGADYAKDAKQPTLVSGRVPTDGSGVTQPISGAVSVTNLPGTQPVSGTIAATQSGVWTVALPSGTTVASTQSGAYTVTQGPAGTAAWKVDGSGVTQPISGSVAVSNFPTTQAVTIGSLPLPAGAATNAAQTAVQSAPGTSAGAAITIQGAASGVALPVAGTFFQATQPVSLASVPSHPVTNAGAFAVQNTAAVVGGNTAAVKTDGSATTQPVSGTVAISGTVPVSGAFYQATQPVSAGSLPLPSGAATAAKQPALGTAGTASADVLTIQGAASMTPVKVDASATTQPVSAASLPLPAGAATSALQTTGNNSLASLDTKTPTLVSGRQPVDGSGVTQPISAASLPLPTGAAQDATLTARLGTLGQKASIASTPVVIASDQTPIPVSVSVRASTFTDATSQSVAANAVFAGGGHDLGASTGAFSRFNAVLQSNQAGTLVIQGSNDNFSNSFNVVSQSVAANTPAYVSISVVYRHHRAVYVNGATAATILTINTSLTAN